MLPALFATPASCYTCPIVVAGRAGEKVAAWLYRHRWVLAVFAGALVVRLHWNLVVHPPTDYVYSDMNGYVQRADRMLEQGLARHEYSSFFPWGTHWIVAGIKYVFGRDNHAAIGIAFALMSAVTVACAHAIAARASLRAKLVAPAVGLVGIFYYPQLSLAGYVLSETPFMAFFFAALVFLMRLCDEGRTRDAIGMGTCAALATVCRPQVMISVAFIGLYWIVRRKALPKVRLVHLLWSAVPLAVVLSLSAALFHHNTGRIGLVSENGSFNLVFGRCHNSKIQSLPDGKGHGKVHFRPPEFLQLNSMLSEKKKKKQKAPIQLDPALGDEISYKGYIGDNERHMAFVRECVAKTGLWGQMKYTWTNVVLLWRHNIPWPDSGRSQWRPPTRWWTNLHRDVLMVPSLLGLMFLAWPRRAVKLGLVAVNIVAMIVVAAIYFGGIRHRTPYDLLLILLALEVYAGLAFGLVALVRRWHARRTGPTGRPTGLQGAGAESLSASAAGGRSSQASSSS